MSDYGSYSSGQGNAWRGDWRVRLLDILRLKGFASLTAFAGTMPLATLEDLVAAIGEGDVAPIQLQWRFVEEAIASNATRECALDLLVRMLHEVKGGWPSDPSWDGQDDVRSSLISWQTSLKGEQYDVLTEKIVHELLEGTSIPPGWLPSGVDDPLLEALFDKHWPQQKSLEELVPIETIRSRYGTYPTGNGHESRGDWEARLLDILQLKGFESLTEFARTMPLATLDDLVAAIGKGDVDASQLQSRFLDEARVSNTMRICTRDLLARMLRGASQGWPSRHTAEEVEELRSILTEWVSSVEEEFYGLLLVEIANELLEAPNIPAGWLPGGGDDPRLVAAFNRHWPKER